MPIADRADNGCPIDMPVLHFCQVCPGYPIGDLLMNILGFISNMYIYGWLPELYRGKQAKQHRLRETVFPDIFVTYVSGCIAHCVLCIVLVSNVCIYTSFRHTVGSVNCVELGKHTLGFCSHKWV